MTNLIKAVAVMVVAYGIGHYFGGSWLAGLIPAIMGFLIGYFWFARGTFNRFTKLSQEAMAAVQEGQEKQDPNLMMSGLEIAMKKFEEGLVLGKEQFLIEEILHEQMGTLAYQGASLQLQLKLQQDAQRNRSGSHLHQKKADQYFTEAKFHLSKAHEKSWTTTLTRQWQGVGMLAAMEWRAGEKDSALQRLSGCKSVGSGDPLYWQMYAWMLLENNQASDAMIVANEGVSKHESNLPLKSLADSIANQKSVDTFEFGMMWYSMFPEQLTLDIAMRMQAQAANPGDMPQMNRQMRRALKKKGYTV